MSKILSLSTNGGGCTSDQKANFPGYGEVWYNPNSMTNVLSLGGLADKYQVCYDSWVEDVFYVHTGSGIKKFAQDKDNLYKYVPATIKKVQFMEMVKEMRSSTQTSNYRELKQQGNSYMQ